MALKTRIRLETKNFLDYSRPNYVPVTRTTYDDYVQVYTTQTGSNREKWNNWIYKRGISSGSLRSRDVYEWGPVTPGDWGTRNLLTRSTFDIQYKGTIGWDPPAGFDTRVEAILQKKLYASLKDARAQWSMATSLGEAKSTARHIAKTAGRLVSAYRNLRRLNFGDFYMDLFGQRYSREDAKRFKALSRHLDNPASLWMEYQYGWMPLLMDVDNAAKYLARKSVDKSQPTALISRRHSEEEVFAQLIESSSPIYKSYQTRLKWKNYCNMRYTYEVRPKYLRTPSTLEELGFTDPASVAWELLPLSFVVDWFVNVGQVLGSLHEFNQWTVVNGLRSSKSGYVVDRDMTRDYRQFPPWSEGTSWRTATETYPATRLRWRYLSRTTLSSLPTAVPLTVNVTNPFDLSNGQIASALSLMKYEFNQRGFLR